MPFSSQCTRISPHYSFTDEKMKTFPILLFLWFFLSIIVGLVGKASGRSFLVWFFISLCIDPILGFLLLQVSKGK